MPKDNGQGVKTLAIRLEPETHRQLSVIAQLEESSLADEIRSAIEAHIVSKRSDAALQAKADAARQAFEQEMAARQGALTSLFGDAPGNVVAMTSPAKARGGRKSAPEGDSSER